MLVLLPVSAARVVVGLTDWEANPFTDIEKKRAITVIIPVFRIAHTSKGGNRGLRSRNGVAGTGQTALRASTEAILA